MFSVVGNSEKEYMYILIRFLKKISVEISEIGKTFFVFELVTSNNAVYMYI